MQLQCVACGAAVTLGVAHCAVCGRPVDADGNGLPDLLDQRVQAAAQKAVADERAKDAARVAAAEEEKRRRTDEQLLKQNVATPRTWGGLALARFRETFMLMLFMVATFGILPRMILASAGFSLAGPALCLVQCPDCGAPGRAFAWNYRGSCQSNKGRMGIAYVCENPVADPSQLTHTAVRSDPLNTELQPYMVHNFWIFVGDVVGWSLLIAALRALLGTGKALGELDRARADLERRLGLR
jgi:hypothetical protein